MLPSEWICNIKVAIFFLMLVSEIIMIVLRSKKDFLKILLRLWMLISIIFYFSKSLNEKKSNQRNYLLIGSQKKVLYENCQKKRKVY